MEDDGSSQPQRRQQQSYRSSNSINWRMKDDAPRQDTAPQGRFRRDNANYEQGQSAPRNSGYGRRENSEYQPREQRDIPEKPETPRLYVGNLLYTAQPGDITNFFASNGFNVVNVSMSIDPTTGRNPSYCFVDLESVEDATAAMHQLNGAEVLGRSVRINPGVARREGQSNTQRRPFGAPVGSGWRDRESAGADSGNVRSSNDRGWGNSRGDAPQQYSRPAPVEQSKRLYIGGLPPMEPQSEVEHEISALFSSADPPIEVVSVSNLIAPHPSKASEPGDHHYLFVDLKAETDAERAIEMFNDADSPFSESGRLRVNRARESKDREGRDGARRGPRDGGRGYGRGYWRGEQQSAE